MGTFAEMPSDVHVIAKAVAEELALEQCRFYGDKTLKVVKGFFSPPPKGAGARAMKFLNRVPIKIRGPCGGFFLNQLYRSRELTAHRGWVRLLLDRRCLVQVPIAPGQRPRADKTKTTTKRAKWKVASTPKLATTPAPNPNRGSV